MTRLIFAAWLFLLIWGAMDASTVIADDRSELASYFEAYEANWSALHTMDVFCQTDRLREPGNEPAMTETVRERLVFDSRNDRYVYVRVGEQRLTDTTERVESIETGFMIKDGQYRSFAVSKRRHPPKAYQSREQVFDEHRMPDWRILMLMNSGRGSSQTWTEKKANALQILPQRVETVKRIASNRSGVTFEFFDNNGAGYRSVFRDEDLMPSKVTWLVRGGAGSMMEVGIERYQWKDMNSIMLPDTVEGTYRDRQFKLTPAEIGKLDVGSMTPEQLQDLFVDVTMHRDMQFEWLGVNSPVDEKLFDFSLVDNPKKFVDLCEPPVGGVNARQRVDR